MQDPNELVSVYKRSLGSSGIIDREGPEIKQQDSQTFSGQILQILHFDCYITRKNLMKIATSVNMKFTFQFV